jgi:hypothetical protein
MPEAEAGPAPAATDAARRGATRRWRVLGRAGSLSVVLACALAVAACGTNAGSSGTTSTTSGQTDPHFPRGSSVGSGIGPAPPIATRVRLAAAAAGCTVRSFPPEVTHRQPDGTLHTLGYPTYHVSLPPVSGLHYPVWADWGVYDTPVPVRNQVHNLEHGGIIIHEGKDLTAQAKAQIVALWRESPAYLLVTPETFAQFPAAAVVVTSWQRWMVCKPYSARDLTAIRVYLDTYRGTGPEYIPAVDSGQTDGVPGLPKPVLADKAAQ